ncbi:DUF2306 domain-containing protein [Asticcacaulis solisilvae]|uniref:DUF2306 domain-containing protein n=1 Tax=Asticcacaulis solisilvae TaxID=1217274 RepID=UPI003FD8A274
MSFLDHFAHPHLPNLAPAMHVSPVIQIHLLAALMAFVIATIQIFGPKGTGLHRTLGWIWVVLMFTVAGSSLFIHLINPHGPGGFSFIHILSGLVLVMLPLMVYAARRHNVNLHRRIATNLYVGALIIAGVFTFLPGRLMWQMFFG